MKIFRIQTPQTLLILNATCGLLAFCTFLASIYLSVRYYDDVFRGSYSDYVIELQEKAQQTDDLQWLRLNLVESLRSEEKYSKAVTNVVLLLLGFGFLYLLLCAENSLFFWDKHRASSHDIG